MSPSIEALIAITLISLAAIPVTECFPQEEPFHNITINSRLKLCGNRLSKMIVFVCLPYGGVGKRAVLQPRPSGISAIATNGLEPLSLRDLVLPRPRRRREYDVNCEEDPTKFARCLCCHSKDGCLLSDLRNFCLDRE